MTGLEFWANWSAYNPLSSACVANSRTLSLVPCIAHRESQLSRCTRVHTSSSSSHRAPGQFPALGSDFPDPTVPGASVTNLEVPDLIVSDRTVRKFCHFNSKTQKFIIHISCLTSRRLSQNTLCLLVRLKFCTSRYPDPIWIEMYPCRHW